MTDLPLPLHVEARGPDPGPGTDTFLLVHGYGSSGFSWRHWAPRLAEVGHVLQLDLKGSGRAPKPDDGRYAPSHQAEVIRRFMEARDLRNVTLVGHSLGGGIALLLALGFSNDRASRLRRLVLVAGAAYPQRLPPFVSLANWPRLSTLALGLIGVRRVVEGALRMVVFDAATVTRDQVRGYAEPLATPGATRALLSSARQVVPPDLAALTRRYSEISLPTLLLWGREDPVVPLDVGQRLAQAVPHARLHVLERCGHLPHEEQPAESYAVLRRFLTDT